MHTESVQANTVRLLTIATLVIGFGLFDASFRQDIETLLEPSVRPFSFIWLVSLLKINVGALSVTLYLVTFLRAGGLLARGNLQNDALVRRRGLFWPLFTLIVFVIILFVAEQLAGAVGSQ